MDLADLCAYLNVLAVEGYAATDGSKNPDGSATITHTRTPWRTVDTYYGGEPYGGSEVVFYDGRPVWLMVYYGAADKAVEDVTAVYRFLKAALANTEPTFPLRGPKQFSEGDLEYANAWDGDLNRFSGVETIKRSGKEIYSARYVGGLVDLRPD